MVFNKGCSAVHFAFGTGCEGVSRDLEVGTYFQSNVAKLISVQLSQHRHKRGTIATLDETST